MKLLNKIGILVFSGLPLVALSQSDPDESGAGESQASPCEQDPRFREFDFWVGEWDVHDAAARTR